MTTSLFQEHFYHSTVRNFLIAFGNLFEDITIVKRDDTSKKIQEYPLPIDFAQKNKWISRLRSQPDLTSNQVQITLPRAAFEITEVHYAPERKIGPNGTYVVGNIGNQRAKIFNPAPYDITMTLTTCTKDENDSLQIMEQILPYFQPFITINFEILPEFNIKKDVPITLESYSVVDTYEGSPDEMRLVTQTYTFKSQLDLFGPIFMNSAIIKSIFIDIGLQQFKPTFEKMGFEVNPSTAAKTDPYTVTETVKILS